MAEIRWTAEAQKWLKDIYDYISQDNPTAATKVVSGIGYPLKAGQFKSFTPRL